jgi:threonine/homoserine/homoserine lactone efflux protein
MGSKSLEDIGMSFEYLVAFNLALLAAIISPGPAFLYLLKMTLSGGRAVGIATGCGLAVMASIWTLMALMGLDGIFRLFPWAYTFFKVGGAIYLLFVAWGIWRHAHEPIGEAEIKNVRAFTGGVLVNLANPKAVLFAAAVLVVIFPPEMTTVHKAMIMGNHLIVEIIVYSGFAYLLSTKSIAAQYLQKKHILDRFAAVVLCGLGLRLVTDR